MLQHTYGVWVWSGLNGVTNDRCRTYLKNILKSMYSATTVLSPLLYFQPR